MTGTDIEPSGAIWLRDALGHEAGETLTRAEAHEVTAKIKSYAGVAWILLLEAHNRQAHKAMGYETWSDYVAAEFDMSRSYSYRLISQAKVVIEISEAAGLSPDGDTGLSPMGDITERETRDLLPVLDKVKEAVTDAVGALPDEASIEERREAARVAMDEMRDAAVAKRKRAQSSKVEPGGVSSDALVAAPHPGSLNAEGEEGAEEPAVPQAAPPSMSPALKMHADLSARRAEVAKWLAFDRHAQVIDAMTVEQRSDYRSFVHSVWTHASETLDRLDNPSRFKAVG